MTNTYPTSVLAFDVYGTLIDPFHMEEHLRAFFGTHAKEASDLWRSKQVEYSFRRALMKKYRNFDTCTEQALHFVAEQLGVSLSTKTISDLLNEYLKLPTYPDVASALSELGACNFAMVAFSNGTDNALNALLRNAGIFSRFTSIVSVDRVGSFKPDPAVYKYLVKQMNVSKHEVWLISSNPFDVIGAKACGLRATWVQRDLKRVFDPWEFEPDLIVHGLEELAGKLDSVERRANPGV